MNNKRVEELISKAIEYIETNKKQFEKDGGIDKVYSGYLNSFGPSVITAGLLQTATFYQGDSKKKKIVEMLFSILHDNTIIDTNEKNLVEFLCKDDNYKNISIKNKVIEAVVACKLAIKTFDLKD